MASMSKLKILESVNTSETTRQKFTLAAEFVSTV